MDVHLRQTGHGLARWLADYFETSLRPAVVGGRPDPNARHIQLAVRIINFVLKCPSIDDLYLVSFARNAYPQKSHTRLILKELMMRMIPK